MTEKNIYIITKKEMRFLKKWKCEKWKMNMNDVNSFIQMMKK
jgi:hypothetical protein